MDKLVLFKEIQEKMYSLYERKNQDYGDSFGKSFKEYGLTVSAIRLEDKLNRLKSLINKLKEKNSSLNSVTKVKDESIYDTLIDLANYSVMTLIELEIQKAEEGYK